MLLCITSRITASLGGFLAAVCMVYMLPYHVTNPLSKWKIWWLGERMPNLSRSRKMRVMWSSKFIATDTYTLIITDKSGNLKHNEGAKMKHTLIWILLKSYNIKNSSVYITWVLIGNNKLFEIIISDCVQLCTSRMVVPCQCKLASNLRHL